MTQTLELPDTERHLEEIDAEVLNAIRKLRWLRAHIKDTGTILDRLAAPPLDDDEETAAAP
jgi:hypothetical protein